MPGFDDSESDPFHPPKVPVRVQCIHCDPEYVSDQIEWVVMETAEGPQGFWCCPMPGCDGKSFGFDIFPTDPQYRDEHGNLMWHEDEEPEDEEGNGNGPRLDPSLN
ncbi:MAG TPA: hypothetical protein VJZ71_13375 [Phycisphaerae bacterium]|nr:hypothetical protein [Phycisphaerae bacterium]